MRRILIVLLVSLPAFCLLFLGPAGLRAAQETGYVHAADQIVPGATVTARQGDMKVVTYTDANGRYTLNLGPGVWEIEVEMLGFTTARQQVTIAADAPAEQASRKDFSMEMPKYGQAPPAAAASQVAAPPPASPETAAATPGQGGGRGRGGFGRGRGGFGRGAPGGQGTGANAAGAAAGGNPGAAGTTPAGPPRPGGQNPGFQNAQVTATQDGQDALAAAAANGLEPLGLPDDSDQAMLVNGSTSGGLGAASDDNARQQRQGGGRGPGGLGGPGGGSSVVGLPPGLTALDSGNLGLGGLGADAINGGFGGGPNGDATFGAGPGGGPGGGGGGGRGGGGGGGFGGGGGGGRGGRGGGGGGGGRGGRGARGAFNGQFNSFGNRRRNTRPAYTGSIALTMTNSALNAEPYSLNGTAAVKPPSASAKYAGNLGGPLVIPKILNWQRAQFQLTYNGQNANTGRSSLSTVPTPAERTGDFSGLMVGTTPTTIYDPLSYTPGIGAQPFSNNTIPTTRLNAAALSLMQYIPQPTYSTPGLVQNYRIVSPGPNNSQNVGLRLNMPLNNKDRLSINVQTQNRNSASQQLFGFLDTSTGYGTSESLTWNHSFAPRFNNSAVVSYSRNVNQSNPYFATAGINVAANAGITGTSQLPIDYGPPSISISSFGGLSDGVYSLNRSQTLSLTDTVTYVWKRKHNLQFGYMWRRSDNDPRSEQSARGQFSFDGIMTSQLVQNPATGAYSAAPGTGYSFADFLLGLPYTTSIQLGSNDYFRSWATSVYAQDDYRLARNVTLNLGVRYEYFAPSTEEYGRLSNIDLSPYLTSAAVVTPSQTSCPTGVYCGSGPYAGSLPSSLIRPQKDMVSPRVGIAWRPSAKHSTVFRSGYSIFYSGSAYSGIVSNMAAQPPFTENAIYTSPLYNTGLQPLTLENGFSSASSSSITNTFAINPNYRLPYAQNWTFAIQQTIPHNILIELEYIGTKGTDLGVTEAPTVTATGGSTIGTTGFDYYTYGANSTYNAGQVRVTRRFSTGMSAVLLYTYSKAIDDATSYTGASGSPVQYPNDWNLERGLSTFDQRHKVSLTYTLSSPVGVRGFMRNGGWKTHALAGWTLQGTFTFGTGFPLTATLSGADANLGNLGAVGGSPRAEATGISIAPVAPGQFFNPAAFTTPPAGQLGNAGVGTITGPDQFSENAALNRAWRISTERREQLQFRLAANNPLNHVYITGFGTALGSKQYDLATSASATRSVTALFRFNF